MLDEEIKEARRNKVVGTSMMLGAVAGLIGTYAFMFWPSQSRGQCLIDMAEKANGNSTIFNALVIANCKNDR